MIGKTLSDLGVVEKEPSKLKYVLYVRKSSEDVGAQAKSLPDQVKACMEYAESKGIIVVETLRESHSAKISGKRPVFTKMLEALEAGKYDGILAWHPDRLARNSLEAGMIVDMVDSGKIKDLKFPTLEFTNDSSGKLLLNIMFAMSKQYSEHLSESVQRGVDSNLAQGKSGGMPKWGYNRNEVTGYYEPDENFDNIKRGFEMYLEGYSQHDIIEYWRQRNVHRLTKITRKNKKVREITPFASTSTIGTILGDPFYYGILIQAGQQVDLRELNPNFISMITEEEFGEVQALRKKLVKKVTATVKAESGKIFIPFRQFVKCGVCGSYLHVARSSSQNKKDKYLYFRCGNPECTRDHKNIRAKVVLEELYKELDKIHFTKEDVEKARDYLTDYIDNRHNELVTDKLRVNAAIKAKKHYQGELAQAYISLTKDAPIEARAMLDKKIRECRQDITDLQAERDEIAGKIFDPDQVREILEEFTNQIINLSDKVKSGDSWQKDQLCRNLLTNLEIDNKNKVSFRWKRPLEIAFSKHFKNDSRNGAPD